MRSIENLWDVLSYGSSNLILVPDPEGGNKLLSVIPSVKLSSRKGKSHLIGHLSKPQHLMSSQTHQVSMINTLKERRSGSGYTSGSKTWQAFQINSNDIANSGTRPEWRISFLNSKLYILRTKSYSLSRSLPSNSEISGTAVSYVRSNRLKSTSWVAVIPFLSHF